jgi:26S proteasome regulatory subunit N10
MPEACIVILDPSEYMRNGDYIPTRYEAQQDAARWLIADITTSNAENTVGVVSGTSVLVSTTNNIGQLFQAVKTSRRNYTKDFELETSIQVAFMALKHRRNKAGSQRIILFVGSPVSEKNNFTKLAKTLRKNNVTLQIITLGEEPNQDKLELLLQDSEESRMISIPKGSVPSEFLSATATFATSAPMGAYGDSVDPSMDPELAMALQVSVEEERIRQAQFQAPTEQPNAETYSDETAMMQQALAMSLPDSMESTSDLSSSRSVTSRSESLPTVEEDMEGEANATLQPAPTDETESIPSGSSRQETYDRLVEMVSRDDFREVVEKETEKRRTTNVRAAEPTTAQIVDQIIESQDLDEDENENFLASLSLEQEMEKDAQSAAMPQEKGIQRQDSLGRQDSLPVVQEEEEDGAENGSQERRTVSMDLQLSINDSKEPPEDDVWEDEPVQEIPFDEGRGSENETVGPLANLEQLVIQVAPIISMEDAINAESDVWEDEPTEEFPDDEDNAVNSHDVWDQSLVATSRNQYEDEDLLVLSPSKSNDFVHSREDDDKKMAAAMSLPTLRQHQQPVQEPIPAPDLNTSVSQESSNWSPDLNKAVSQESSNWSPINRELDEYYTASSETDGAPATNEDPLPIPFLEEEEGSQAIRSCWSNLDEAFDEYNTAINEISNYLPTTVGMAPSSPPPRQEEEERQDIVSCEEYKRMAKELDEAKKAMAIMHGIVEEKDGMIVALREILGMMHQERTKNKNEGSSSGASVEGSASEREMTETLIKEIQKKNRNLESLRHSLGSNKQSSADARSATVPVTPSLLEKRKKKRDLEKLRAKLKHPKL